ncbi:hypothetical protein J4457_04095 [Candidatus Woesearchaeota archaeon]|nr:hypothetical protein [Candidatus Woesearchaeota archaeon]
MNERTKMQTHAHPPDKLYHFFDGLCRIVSYFIGAAIVVSLPYVVYTNFRIGYFDEHPTPSGTAPSVATQQTKENIANLANNLYPATQETQPVYSK